MFTKTTTAIKISESVYGTRKEYRFLGILYLVKQVIPPNLPVGSCWEWFGIGVNP